MKEGWKYKKLGEIATIRRGLTYKKEDEVEKSNKIVLRSNNVDLETHQLIFDELKYLKDDFDIPEEKILKKGDLLMCMSNGSKIHLGKVALIEQNIHFAFGGFMSAIEHNKSVLDKFFYYALISPNFKQHIKELQDGANINNLKIRDIESFSIPVPPLPDQQRIVTYLDAEFAKIEALKANAEKQLQAAKDLFQAALKELLTPKEGWVEKKLGDCLSKLSDGSHNPPKGVDVSPYKMLSSRNVGNNCLQDLENVRYLSEKDFIIENRRTNAKPYDVLLTIVGTIGRCTTLKEDDLPITFQRSVAVMTPQSNLNSFFLMYYLLCNNSTLEKEAQGAAQKGIYLNQIKNLTIAYPCIGEQQRIADRLDALSANVKALQTNYTETITLCNDLKQALLKKVFEEDG